MNLDPLDLAWAAGFLDGEGSFFVRKNGPRTFSPGIQAGQNHLEPLEKLQTMFGGSICPRRTSPRDFWSWERNGAKGALIVLPQVIPYLVCKKKQAEILFEYAARQTRRGYGLLDEQEISIRASLDQELRALKRM